MAHVIGIDVSKATLDCAYLRDIDQEKAKRKNCQNIPRAFESLLVWAESISGLSRQALAFVIEPTSIYHELLVRFLYEAGATVYLVNPNRVRKFAEGIGILSKNDVIDADLLARYGLLARKLITYEPPPKEIEELKSLLNRLESLDNTLRRELNRQEKVGKTRVLHPLERQSIARAIRQLKREIVLFKKTIRQCIKTVPSLKHSYKLLITIPGVGAKTAWIMLVILASVAIGGSRLTRGGRYGK